MKQIAGLTLVLLICSCSKSKDQKAKDLIVDHLKISMNDYNSYQSIDFSKLDSTVTTYMSSQSAKEKVSIVNSIKDSVEELQRQLLYSEDIDKRRHIIKLLDSSSAILTTMQKENNYFKPQFNGYAMSHSFRGKNSFGALVLNVDTFYFDKTLSKIVAIKP